MDKEIFSEIGLGERREVDLVARVRMRGGEAHFLVHLENQAQPVSEALSRLEGCDVTGLRRIKKRLLAGKPLEELF